MADKLEAAQYVLIVCTERYYNISRGKALPEGGLGVAWESTLINNELYNSKGKQQKFIPVMFEMAAMQFIPEPLRSHTHYVLHNETSYEDLLRSLTDQPKHDLGPVGPNRQLPSTKVKPLRWDSQSQTHCNLPELEQSNPKKRQVLVRVIFAILLGSAIVYITIKNHSLSASMKNDEKTMENNGQTSASLEARWDAHTNPNVPSSNDLDRSPVLRSADVATEGSSRAKVEEPPLKPKTLPAIAIRALVSKTNTIEAVRSEATLRQLTMWEDGKDLAEIPIRTFCFISTSYFGLQNITSEQGLISYPVRRTASSRVYFEIHKISLDSYQLIAYVSNETAARLSHLSGLVDVHASLFPMPIEGIQMMVVLPLERLQRAKSREMMLGENSRIEPIDVTLR